MGPVWEDADGEEIVNETFTRLEKAFHAIFSERDAVASNLLRASVTSIFSNDKPSPSRTMRITMRLSDASAGVPNNLANLAAVSSVTVIRISFPNLEQGDDTGHAPISSRPY